MNKKLLTRIGITFVILTLTVSACKKESISYIPVEAEEQMPGDEDLPYHWKTWMGHVPDSFYLSQITIPGTHDAGADKHTSHVGWPEWHYVICQDFDISNQMKLGVRWFDIRLYYHSGGDLSVHHSKYYLHKNFDDVIMYAKDFLKDHHKETIILMIKQEYSSVSDHSFGEAVYKRFEKHGLEHFYLEDKMPTLGEVRGKIYIVRRFHNKLGKPCGTFVWWPDNTKGSYNHYGKIGIYAQDHYSLHTVSTDTKYNEVVSTIKKAHDNTDHNRFYLNFVSGERVPEETLWETADKINYRVEDYLDGHAKHWLHCGVIMINFAGGGDDDHKRNCAPQLVAKILYHNPGVPY